MTRPGFAGEVIDLVRARGIPASRVILEVTETAVVTDPVRARGALSRLRQAGFRISIDDFGAGQTSLTQLVDMPIDEIKIDRTFVQGMLDDARNAAVVRAVVELAHSLGATVVAEGVETAEVLAALTDLDCDVAQGYHLGRPAPVSQLAHLLRGRRDAEDVPVEVG